MPSNRQSNIKTEYGDYTRTGISSMCIFGISILKTFRNQPYNKIHQSLLLFISDVFLNTVVEDIKNVMDKSCDIFNLTYLIKFKENIFLQVETKCWETMTSH